MEVYCKENNIDFLKIFEERDNFKKIKLCDDAVENILKSEDSKKKFINLAGNLKKLFKAVLPDIEAERYLKQVLIISILVEKVNEATSESVDKSEIEILTEKVENLLNQSIVIGDYQIKDLKLFDLGQVDFEELQARFFNQDRQKTLVEKIKASLRNKIQSLLELNKLRIEYMQKFEKLIDEYNSGDINIEQLYLELVKLSRSLDEGEKCHMQENLSEEELVIFDILTKPEPKLSKKEQEQVKEAAKELIAILKKEKLVIDVN